MAEPLPPDKAALILAMKAADPGLSARAIARAVGTTASTVLRHLRGLKKPAKRPRPPRPPREPSGRYITRDKARYERMRAMFLANEKYAVIAKELGVSVTTIREHTRDLPRRDLKGVFKTMKPERCVIIEVFGESGPYMVQPTGRMEFCSSALAPERQWHLEAVDTRDGRIKLLPVADISKWAQPVANGPAITSQKILHDRA